MTNFFDGRSASSRIVVTSATPVLAQMDGNVAAGWVKTISGSAFIVGDGAEIPAQPGEELILSRIPFGREPTGNRRDAQGRYAAGARTRQRGAGGVRLRPGDGQPRPGAEVRANATRAARTASSSSTRSARPRTTSSSPTPAPTNAPARRCRRPYRSASCSTPSTGPLSCRTLGCATSSPRTTRCSRSTRATSSQVSRAAVQLRPAGYAGARAAAGPRAEPPPVFSAPLPSAAGRGRRPRRPAPAADPPGPRVPAPAAQVAETRGEDEPADALPVELDNLELWAVGERVLRERLAGLDPAECIELEAHRGDLPPGPARRRDALRVVGRKVEGSARRLDARPRGAAGVARRRRPAG